MAKIYIENVNGVVKYSKLKKHLKKTHLCVMSAINFSKNNFSKNIKQEQCQEKLLVLI